MRIPQLLLCLLLLPPLATAQPVSAVAENDTDFRVPAEIFPIYPWDILPARASAYQDAKDAGFNLAGFVHPDDLDLVAAAKLKAFVSDPSIKIRGNEKFTDDQIEAIVKPLVARTATHPAVIGYHLIDEPSPQLTPIVARWAAAFRAAAPPPHPPTPSPTPTFSRPRPAPPPTPPSRMTTSTTSANTSTRRNPAPSATTITP